MQYEATGDAKEVTYLISLEGDNIKHTDKAVEEKAANTTNFNVSGIINHTTTAKMTVTPETGQVAHCKITLDPEWKNHVVLAEITGKAGEPVICEATLPQTETERAQLDRT